jgi:hypothetical protein
MRARHSEERVGEQLGIELLPQCRHSTSRARVGSVIAILRERARARVPSPLSQPAVSGSDAHALRPSPG